MDRKITYLRGQKCPDGIKCPAAVKVDGLAGVYLIGKQVPNGKIPAELAERIGADEQLIWMPDETWEETGG